MLANKANIWINGTFGAGNLRKSHFISYEYAMCCVALNNC